MERRSNRTCHRNTEELKAAIAEAWAAIPTASTIKAMRAFRGRIEKVIDADGYYFEK